VAYISSIKRYLQGHHHRDRNRVLPPRPHERLGPRSMVGAAPSRGQL